MKGKMDWQKLKSMTDEETFANATSDSDAPPATLEQLRQFKRVHPLPKTLIKKTSPYRHQ